MENAESIETFYGYLGRARFEAGQAVLRFYPFALVPDEVPEPVLELRFYDPSFTLNDVESYVDNDEVEVTARSNSAEVYYVFAGLTQTLGASSMNAVTMPYDIYDYKKQVKAQSKHNAKLDSDLWKLRGQLGSVQSIATELLRRAEIKGAASEEHLHRQLPAIDVLKRILVELKDES